VEAGYAAPLRPCTASKPAASSPAGGGGECAGQGGDAEQEEGEEAVEVVRLEEGPGGVVRPGRRKD